MHIYYYKKDGYYYVMNENGTLEKYSVTNNIAMILKQENLIKYFTKELLEEENKFCFKTFQELDYNEKLKLSQMLEPIILGEYIILQDNALPVFIAEASIISIINKIYYNRKKSIQNGDKLLGDILTELLEPLKENLEYIKQISHCKKEIVPLSEFDPDASKTYVESIEEEIISYNDDINNLLSLELDPESIFYNTEYDTKLESGKYTKSELESERKIKTIKEIYLQEMREEVKTKLDYIKTEKDMDYFYLFANGITTSMMLMHVLTYYYNPNSDFEKYHIVTLIANIVCYSKYYKNKKKLEKSSNPILKLEKKDK